MLSVKDKYISTAENEKKPDNNKIILSNDAFAIIEILEELAKELSFRFGRI